MMIFRDYIMSAPLGFQVRLLDMLLVIHDELPGAEEQIYQGIPSFFIYGNKVISVGAYQKCIGVHIDYATLDYLKQKYPNYEYIKSGIWFPYSQPQPFDIIKDICAQIATNQETYQYQKNAMNS